METMTICPTVIRNERGCSLTGEMIHSCEVGINFAEARVKKKATDKCKEVLDGKVKNIGDVKVEKSNDMCSRCCDRKAELNIIVTRKVHNLNYNAKTGLCESCIDEIRTKLDKVEEYIENRTYWVKDRFCAIYMDGDYNNSISSMNFIEKDSQLGLNIILPSTPICASNISNIQKLKNSLRNGESPGENDNIRCNNCNEKDGSILLLRDANKILLCKECRDNILEALNNFEEEKKKFIVSNSI